MINVSEEYKEVMSRPIRNRAYISVGVGIVNQNAQTNSVASGNFTYFSYGDIFNQNQSKIEYATLEDNLFRLDSSLLFMPENNELMQLKANGKTTSEVLGSLRVNFGEVYAIKGLTIDFGNYYPTQFQLITEEKTLTYDNTNNTFVTSDVLGETRYIIIKPLTMVGGQQRLRIKSILMGVGLNYSNKQTKQFKLVESVSPISEDLPITNTTFSFYDEENQFDVDDDNSFIDFLETMQKITISFGVELDNGSVEWNQIATQFLSDWKVQKGVVTLSATDRLQQMEDEYSLGYKIYTRTAYKEAESILQDAGLQPDEYIIDDYLDDITLTNPMPKASHKECLQMLANACRCIIRQDEEGKVIIRANFAVVLDPEDLAVSTNGSALWSKPSNILLGETIVYADMTEDFYRLNGVQYFMPENQDYLNTAYVSDEISDTYGKFTNNPAITITMPASYTYYGVNVYFDGNPPKELIIHTYKGNDKVEDVKFRYLQQESFLIHEFKNFDKMVFEVTETKAYNRVLVRKISFGALSDYVLTRLNMMEQPIGYKEKRTKAVKVRVYKYQTKEDSTIEEVEDEVYATKVLNIVGETKTVLNSLISTQEQAETIAEWVGNYYSNNVSYDVKYRGEPRLNASDIIHMESNKRSNLQVEITKATLDFDGAFSGELELRRALRENR